MLPVPIVRLDPDLPLPAYAHQGDAGLDLRAREDGEVRPGGGRLLMPTGVSVAIPGECRQWSSGIHSEQVWLPSTL